MKHKHLFKKVFDGTKTVPSVFPEHLPPEPANVVEYRCSCGKGHQFVDVLGGSHNSSLPDEFTTK